MKSFKFKKSSNQASEDFSKDFKESHCRCVQQELVMSTTWIDVSNFKNAKKMLKTKSIEMLKAIRKSQSQRDLFE